MQRTLCRAESASCLFLSQSSAVMRVQLLAVCQPVPHHRSANWVAGPLTSAAARQVLHAGPTVSRFTAEPRAVHNGDAANSRSLSPRLKLRRAYASPGPSPATTRRICGENRWLLPKPYFPGLFSAQASV